LKLNKKTVIRTSVNSAHNEIHAISDGISSRLLNKLKRYETMFSVNDVSK